jgi:hypothetical protein
MSPAPYVRGFDTSCGRLLRRHGKRGATTAKPHKHPDCDLARSTTPTLYSIIGVKLEAIPSARVAPYAQHRHPERRQCHRRNPRLG